MNRYLLMVALLFIFVVPQAWGLTAQDEKNAYNESLLNSFTDKLNTLGQSSQQAQSTTASLRRARAQVRLAKYRQAEKAKRQAQIQADAASNQ